MAQGRVRNRDKGSQCNTSCTNCHQNGALNFFTASRASLEPLQAVLVLSLSLLFIGPPDWNFFAMKVHRRSDIGGRRITASASNAVTLKSRFSSRVDNLTFDEKLVEPISLIGLKLKLALARWPNVWFVLRQKAKTWYFSGLKFNPSQIDF